jgi:hypothetical protein
MSTSLYLYPYVSIASMLISLASARLILAVPLVVPLFPYEIVLITFQLSSTRIVEIVRFPDHLTSMRVSLPAHTDLRLRFITPVSVGRTHGSLPTSIVPPLPLLNLCDADRNPANHSGSYPSIIGLVVGV